MKAPTASNLLLLRFSLTLNFILILFDDSTAIREMGSGVGKKMKDERVPDFTMLVMGGSVRGPVEGTTSGYLIKPFSTNISTGFLAFEAGTLLHGIHLLQRSNHLPQSLPATQIHQHLIKGYLISHPISITPLGLRESLFNNVAWPDVVTMGGFYAYKDVREGEEVEIAGMNVTVYGVSHGGIESTCFLIRGVDGGAVLLCGDMGPDSVEGTTRNAAMWSMIAPLIVTRQLRSIMLECSYASTRRDGALYGHLTPRYVVEELRVLEGFVKRAGGEMKGVEVFVETLKRDLEERGEGLEVEFVFAMQGQRIDL
ncbi:cAMP phosphodiesterases class-II-domain-containing protein [Chytridium lagenaria]|nr:cAMP phosphodiesterases class-II-domain-containing protein [Chytridium lagenaria]